MPPKHTVVQGEHVTSIAAQYGFADYRTVWDHPENLEIKNLRKDPNVLMPGDRLHIPERQVRTESASTGRIHRFKLRRSELRLRLIIQDGEQRTYSGKKYRLETNQKTYEGTIPEDGLIDHEISSDCTEARLRLWLRGDPDGPGVLYALKIGSLDPATTRSGVEGRLINLGFLFASTGESEPEHFARAVRQYQKAKGLPVTGRINADMCSKLKADHGV